MLNSRVKSIKKCQRDDKVFSKNSNYDLDFDPKSLDRKLVQNIVTLNICGSLVNTIIKSRCYSNGKVFLKKKAIVTLT